VENKANYALIGMFVLFAVIAVLGFAIWLSGAQFNKKYDFYEIAFDGGVRGLSQGSEVRFNGLGVGEVKSLAYDRENINLVLAQIEVIEGTPIDVNSSAKLTPLGLTGLNYIEITPGIDAEAPLMAELPGRGVKRIVGEGSSVDTLLSGGGDVVVQAQTAVARVNALLSEDNLETFSKILENIEQITASVDLSNLDAKKLNEVLDSITAAANAIESTAKAYEGTSETVNVILSEDLRRAIAKIEGTLTSVDATLAGVDTTVTGFGATAGNADELIADARNAVNRLSNSGLTDVEDTLQSIRELVTSLSRVADSLEQSPTQFVVGTERETVELPQ